MMVGCSPPPVYFSAAPALASHGPSLPSLPALRARCPSSASSALSRAAASAVSQPSPRPKNVKLIAAAKRGNAREKNGVTLYNAARALLERMCTAER